MRHIALAVLLAATLGACGGDAEDDAGKGAETSETPSAEPELTMRDVCPMVEDALPKNGFKAGADGFQSFADELEVLHAQADPEAQNAIEEARAGTDRLVKVLESGKTGLFASEGEEAFLQGMNAMARRCKAAGSSALQS